MRPVVVSVTGVGTSPVVPLDYLQLDFKVALGAVVSGTVTYTIQHTFDNILDPTVTPTWFNHDSMVDLTANEDGNYFFPVRGTRVNLTAGTGTVTLTVLQGNPR
jgi:hypothetical protein